ncbi:MAG: phosphate/phosphite/phosphonate ABC transporter substrate-binding protein [Leptolyngbya sp. SIO3F4]|nr:phosphate/phosphite/phosphonate ABC transporter substrate-binding protein [Leptolyngbya sp. SIO3F4]
MLSVLIGVLLLSCSESTQDSEASPQNSTSETAAWPETIRFGLIPAEGGTDIVDRFQSLFDHIAGELETDVKAFSASEYVGVITAMQNDQVDVAYFGPKSYVEAHRIAGAEAVVKQLSDDGSEGYHSIIVTRRGSGILSLEGAEGKRFGFVTPNSTSGYLVPSIGIIEATGKPAEEYFSEVRFTGSHSTAVRAALTGDVDVAATNTLDLGAMERNGLDTTGLVELWRSDMIPGAVIAVRDDLPESFKQAIRESMISFNENEEALKNMARGGFVPAEDAEYDIIRLLEQRREVLEREGG